MAGATKEFLRATAALARSAPREWEAFITELRLYADRKRDECVQSPLADLPVAQGRAQGVNQLTKDISEAKTQADKIGSR